MVEFVVAVFLAMLAATVDLIWYQWEPEIYLITYFIDWWGKIASSFQACINVNTMSKQAIIIIIMAIKKNTHLWIHLGFFLNYNRGEIFILLMKQIIIITIKIILFFKSISDCVLLSKNPKVTHSPFFTWFSTQAIETVNKKTNLDIWMVTAKLHSFFLFNQRLNHDV